MMHGENICHLNIQCWFRSCIKIIELINVELSLGVRNRNYCMSGLESE